MAIYTKKTIRLGETVFSPFMGIGSEGYEAIKNNRKFIKTELKPSYYKQALKYLTNADQENKSMLF